MRSALAPVRDHPSNHTLQTHRCEVPAERGRSLMPIAALDLGSSRRVLLVIAHPDDESMCAAGTQSTQLIFSPLLCNLPSSPLRAPVLARRRFFAPTVAAAVRSGATVSVLSLSTGAAVSPHHNAPFSREIPFAASGTNQRM